MVSDDQHNRVAREINVFLLPRPVPDATDAIAGVLRRNYGPMPECGHPAQCVYTSDEGTSYCSWCAGVSELKVKLEKALGSLKFYGNSGNYKANEIAADHSHLYAAIENDKGRHARAVLKEIGDA